MGIVPTGAKVHAVPGLVQNIPTTEGDEDNQDFKRIEFLEKSAYKRKRGKPRYRKTIGHAEHKLIRCRMKESFVQSFCEVGRERHRKDV